MFQPTIELKKESIVLKELTFDDKAGHWRYNLFYSPASIDNSKELVCEDRKDVVERSSDVFALFYHEKCFTLICRSWRIRDDAGKLRLPTPRGKLLYRDNLGDRLSMEEYESEEESSSEEESLSEEESARDKKRKLNA